MGEMKQGDKKGKGMSLTEPYVFHWLQHPNTAQPFAVRAQGRQDPLALVTTTVHPTPSPA